MKLLALLLILPLSALAQLPVPIPLIEASHALGAVQYNCLSNGYCYVRIAYSDLFGNSMMRCTRLPNQPLAVSNGWVGLTDYDPVVTPSDNIGLTAAEMAWCISDNTTPPLLTWKVRQLPPFSPYFVWSDKMLSPFNYANSVIIDGTAAGIPCEPETMLATKTTSYHYVTGKNGKRGLADCSLQ